MKRAALLGLFTGLLASVSATAQTLPPRQDPDLSKLREIRSTWIIEFDSSVSREELPARARGLAARFEGRIRHVYGTAYNGFAVQMSETAIARLLEATDTSVRSVSRDQVASIVARPGWAGGGGGGGGGSDCTQVIDWNIKRIITGLAGAPNCAATGGRQAISYDSNLPVTPGGIEGSVCVIDTGVDFNHPDLNVNTAQSRTFAGGRDASDKNGHGTHVAGTIAGVDNKIGVLGVAPGARITAIKVLGNGGTGSYADVIAGVNYAADIGCDVANMSLGGPPSDALDSAVKTAAGLGVMFSLAAGNSSADANNHSPARANGAGIYTIASFAEGDAWSSFSNFGQPPVDFALPGSAIRSTVPGGYATYSGTSMAAPHMAGLLLRQITGGGAYSVQIAKISRTSSDKYDVPFY